MKRLTFEEERLAAEHSKKINRLIQTRLDAVEGEITPELIADAVNNACAEIDPDDGELTYELDEDAQ